MYGKVFIQATHVYNMALIIKVKVERDISESIRR